MKAKIPELKIAVNELLDKLAKYAGDEIEVSVDYYWSIDENELYNPYKNPVDLTLGQISSDMEDLHNIVLRGEYTCVDLLRVSEIIKAVCIENKNAF
jgi:hypothetical protein